MVAHSSDAKLVVIVGETGSGKSALGLKLAKKFNGEIICADSRTVYKGMDIGTAKPSKRDQRTIRHHLLDAVKPSESFTVADFKRLANQAIEDITNRGKLPIVVGGSGLYIDALIYDYGFNPKGQRHPRNPRHRLDSPVNKKLRLNTLIFGLKISQDKLEQCIKKRVDNMIKQGFTEEIKKLLNKYHGDLEAFKAPGYKAFIQYEMGLVDLEKAKSLFIQYDLNLAKRQRTWFKRNKSIHWLANREKSVELVTTFLNK